MKIDTCGLQIFSKHQPRGQSKTLHRNEKMLVTLASVGTIEAEKRVRSSKDSGKEENADRLLCLQSKEKDEPLVKCPEMNRETQEFLCLRTSSNELRTVCCSTTIIGKGYQVLEVNQILSFQLI